MFKQSKIVNRLSPRTIQTYEQRLKTFLEGHGQTPIQALTEQDCEQWCLTLYRQRVRWHNHQYKPQEKGGLSEATIHGRITALKSFLNWAVDMRLITHSPAHHIRNKRPQLDRYKRTSMSLHTLARLMAGANNERDRAIISFLAETGCRVSECANVLMVDVNLNDRTALLRASKAGPGILTFTDETVNYIHEWLRVRPDTLCPNLFVGIHAPNLGDHMTGNTIYQMMQRIAKENGLSAEITNPHSIRSMVATIYANQAHIHDAQNKLRHTDPKTTMIYVQTELDTQKKLDNQLSPIKEIKKRGQ